LILLELKCDVADYSEYLPYRQGIVSVGGTVSDQDRVLHFIV
jgi:hypothetical protein